MRILILAGSFFLFATASAQADKVTAAQTDAVWYADSRLVLSYSYPDSSSFAPERQEGENSVFEYTYRAAENPAVADDEFMEVISFQFPVQKHTRFTLRKAGLVKAKAYYLRGCFCQDRGFTLIQDGVIRARKLNSTTWLVDINIWIDGPNGRQLKKANRKFHISRS